MMIIIYILSLLISSYAYKSKLIKSVINNKVYYYELPIWTNNLFKSNVPLNSYNSIKKNNDYILPEWTKNTFRENIPYKK